MDSKNIKYGDSKAIKITVDMRNSLNAFNARENEIFNLEIEKQQKEQLQAQKQTELGQVNDDGKQTKAIEKEIEKIVSEIEKIEEKQQNIELKHKKPAIKGANVNAFASITMPKSNEQSIAQNELELNEKLNAIEGTPEEVKPEIPVVAETPQEEPIVEKETENQEDSLISELETDEEESAQENMPNIFSYDFTSQEEFEEMWKKLEGLVTNEDNEENDSHEIKEFNEDNDFEEIDIKPNIPDPVKITRIEDQADNLTKFNDYNEYVFDFGQNHYDKEALTPEEIESLNNIDEFLSEEEFYIKRNEQYAKIKKEDNDLKDKIIELDNNYRKELEDTYKKYSDNIKKLKEEIKTAKEEIQNTKSEKEQTDKLNANLTSTIKQQDQTILDLNAKNKGLQDTIVNQSSKITALEKANEHQNTRINDLEDKFNSVQSILKI